MWQSPWKLRQGLLVGFGVLLVGTLLQLAVGAVSWTAIAYPRNLFCAIAFFSLVATLYALRARLPFVRFIASLPSALSALFYAILLLAIMGFTAQTPDATTAETTPFQQMTALWAFVLVFAWIAFIVAFVTLRQLHHFRIQKLPSLLSHLGLLFALGASALGSADLQRLQLHAERGRPEWRAVNSRDGAIDLPFLLRLDSVIESTNKGFPQQTNAVTISTKDAPSFSARIAINHPLDIGAYKVYHSQSAKGNQHQPTSARFEIVYDPWQPFVYLGFGLLLAGAIFSIVKAGFHSSSTKL